MPDDLKDPLLNLIHAYNRAAEERDKEQISDWKKDLRWKFLAALRAIEPEIKLGALGSKEVDAEKLAEIASIQPVMVGWKDSDITPPAIAAFHQAEYAVAIWTVNDPRRMQALAKSGVDIIITDQPAKARQTMNKEP